MTCLEHHEDIGFYEVKELSLKNYRGREYFFKVGRMFRGAQIKTIKVYDNGTMGIVIKTSRRDHDELAAIWRDIKDECIADGVDLLKDKKFLEKIEWTRNLRKISGEYIEDLEV
jgi:hypothetical protein